MIDTQSIHQAAKISWIRRLFQTTDAKWKTLMLHMLNIDKQNLNKTPGVQINNKVKTSYHTQILKAWYTLIGTTPQKQYTIS